MLTGVRGKLIHSSIIMNIKSSLQYVAVFSRPKVKSAANGRTEPDLSGSAWPCSCSETPHSTGSPCKDNARPEDF